MKNTLIFLLTEGIGLNKKWKGNYLKLAEKPNINYLISGIYPWALISNERKHDKNIFKKEYDAVKRDVDANFYEMLYGTKEIKTYLELFKECVENKNLQDLKVFDDLVQRSNTTGSKYVHLFAMLSDNQNKFNIDYIYFTINVLLLKGLKPVVHLISDGQEERPYNFNKSIVRFSKFLMKRHTPIATIAGRNHVFPKNGHGYLENKHVFNYFETLCGIGDKWFTNPLEYANENLANRIMDADIRPAYNSLLRNIFLSKRDSVLFLNADPDDFSSIAATIKSEPKFDGIYLSSLAPIFGTKVDSLFFENPVENFQENLLTNMISKKDGNALVLSLNHKKGFVNKFFGENHKNPNIDRKILSTSYCSSLREYYFSAPKVLIDKTIESIGKYDIIFVHIPTIAESAKTSDLKDLSFAIDAFDKNLGRLINFCKSTGNIISFTSAYGSAEKMLDKHLNIIPYNKNSPVPFVFTNGDLSSKKMKSSFVGIYASILASLNLLEDKSKLYYLSLINPNFSKNKIEDSLLDAYDVWKNDVATPLITNFEENRLNFYSEFSKDEQFFEEKKQYVVLKELVKINENILLTPEARKKLFKSMLDYMTYNKIDFVGFNLDIMKILQTLFNSEIDLQKLSKLSNKFFDKKIWSTNFTRNDKWVNKTKVGLFEMVNRSVNISKKQKTLQKVYDNFTPFLFFDKIKHAEIDVLKTNDAVAITKFYELIKDEVKDIYEKWVSPRISEEDEEKEADELAAEKALYPLASYYDHFNEVVELVEDNKENATAYNKKYLDSIKHLKSKHKNYDDIDIFERPDVALNPLVSKIIKIYKFYFKDIDNSYKLLFQNIKKVSNKYDNNYNLKYSIAQKSKVYDGEFLEDVDLTKQGEYKEQFIKQFEIFKEFDSQSIDISEEEKMQDSVFDKEVEIEFDDEGNPIIVDNIDKNINTRPEYNLSEIWVEKRLEEYKDMEKFKANVVEEAESEINSKKKFDVAKEKVDNYNNMSENWKKEVQGLEQ